MFLLEKVPAITSFQYLRLLVVYAEHTAHIPMHALVHTLYAQNVERFSRNLKLYQTI